MRLSLDPPSRCTPVRQRGRPPRARRASREAVPPRSPPYMSNRAAAGCGLCMTLATSRLGISSVFGGWVASALAGRLPPGAAASSPSLPRPAPERPSRSRGGPWRFCARCPASGGCWSRGWSCRGPRCFPRGCPLTSMPSLRPTSPLPTSPPLPRCPSRPSRCERWIRQRGVPGRCVARGSMGRAGADILCFLLLLLLLFC
mmetsp:Transcript_11313/g.35757  ORF Transcript_11313/g.35757 Transcript_11313/m.35757 type:complete len:201 (-) Transcript_11313:54-656(-)